MSKRRSPQSNHLLEALPFDDLARMRAHATEVELVANSTLHEAGGALDYVYFLNDGLVSLLVVMRNGSAVETGFVGPEGAVGTISSVPARTSFTRSTVITSGTALRLPFEQFERVTDQSKTFRHLITQNNERIAKRGQQIAACNLVHHLESRVCRWLLQVVDNSDNPSIVITQDNLSQMLGVNRARLSETLKSLQTHGAIAQTQRGLLTIIDADPIRERACDCYAIMRFPHSN